MAAISKAASKARQNQTPKPHVASRVFSHFQQASCRVSIHNSNEILTVFSASAGLASTQCFQLSVSAELLPAWPPGLSTLASTSRISRLAQAAIQRGSQTKPAAFMAAVVSVIFIA